MQPRPFDLVALADLLPTGAIVVTFDVETCADPAGGDARVAGRARVIQLGIAAFSGVPLPGCGDAVPLPVGRLPKQGTTPRRLHYAHRSDAPMLAPVPVPAYAPIDSSSGDDVSDADLLASYTYDSDGEPTEPDHACTPAEVDAYDPGDPSFAPVAGFIFSDVITLNPGCRIDAASQAVHKITDAQTRQGPTLAAVADELLLWLTGCDPETGEAGRPVYLAGYNAARYDVPVLAADLRRVGRADVAELLERTPLLDAYLIRKAAEQPMTLTGSVARYGLGDMKDAHDAGRDATATLAVLAAQAGCGHVGGLAVALALNTPKAAPVGAVDAQGKLRWLDGKPAEKPSPDNVVLNFGKHKDKTLRVAGPGYSQWILKGDFPDDVKSSIRTAWGPAAARW